MTISPFDAMCWGAVTELPSHVNEAEPPNALELLNCTFVLAPPGAPPATAHVPSPLQKVLALADVPLFRLVTGKLPVTPVVNGNPVPLVNVTLVGVPNIGVTNVGDVAKATTVPDPVVE